MFRVSYHTRKMLSWIWSGCFSTKEAGKRSAGSSRCCGSSSTRVDHLQYTFFTLMTIARYAALSAVIQYLISLPLRWLSVASLVHGATCCLLPNALRGVCFFLEILLAVSLQFSSHRPIRCLKDKRAIHELIPTIGNAKFIVNTPKLSCSRNSK